MLTITELNNQLNKRGYELNKHCVANKSHDIYIKSIKTGNIHGCIIMEEYRAGTYKFDRKNKKVHELLTEFCKQVKEFYDNHDTVYIFRLKDELFDKGTEFYEYVEDNDVTENYLYLTYEGLLHYKERYYAQYTDKELKESGLDLEKIDKFFVKEESWYHDKKIYDVLD